MTNLQTVFQVEHPVALVTGSGSPRVGREIAVRLASLGCRLALHADSSTEQAKQAAVQIAQQHDSEVIVTAGALQDEATARSVVESTHRHFGRIDILVNSAAIWSPLRFDAVTADELRRYFDVNVIGSFVCAKTAGMMMVEQPGGGAIVNISDWATVRPYLDHAAYFPSKGAVETMTRSLAVELASRNPAVRVNCVCPGPVLFADDTSDEMRARIASSTLVGKAGTPQHVAHAVQFLCENDFVTGICLPVDGGRQIYAPDGLQIGLNSG